MKFVCTLYRVQHESGRYFLHEHPLQARSWDLACIKALQKLEGVHVVETDQCQYGQEDSDGAPIKKVGN